MSSAWGKFANERVAKLIGDAKSVRKYSMHDLQNSTDQSQDASGLGFGRLVASKGMERNQESADKDKDSHHEVKDEIETGLRQDARSSQAEQSRYQHECHSEPVRKADQHQVAIALLVVVELKEDQNEGDQSEYENQQL